ncbi:hypothetical protein [Flavimaricola marinus]|uniref:Uncharacterized protein n=1 Tax=Flavimaricola marinus TaxID=1819565 RepID=A0A238LEI9_9RHOB|nr:hypothetical protein [Flavimaricola marinus]SMY07376.1 hypothetical protein LOM8899_01511 [Flavimaricola marinus]
MNYIHWMMRAKRWAQNPPSASRVVLVLGVIALCLALFAVERFVGWPEWLTPTAARRPVIR